MVYRAIYFEVFMIHMAWILTKNFSWEVLSGLSPRFVNHSLASDMLTCVAIALVVLFFVTEPCKNLWYKYVELPVFYGVRAGVLFDLEGRGKRLRISVVEDSEEEEKEGSGNKGSMQTRSTALRSTVLTKNTNRLKLKL
jgi:hypothetical protein